MSVPLSLRIAVIERAKNHCEYCLLSQLAQEATFHIDHIIPESAGGATTWENLALACVSCSLRKGARQTAVDPISETEVRLFNPRTDAWRTHFRFERVKLIGLSATARATIDTLQLNRPHIVAIREEERWRGRLPNV